MIMTRQHFQFIADTIREKFTDSGHRTMIASAFADRLAETNPRFDRAKFIAASVIAKPTYYDCGICGHFHNVEWNGDCREDEHRHSYDDLDARFGVNQWKLVPMADVLPKIA